ncbi:MAG: GNAT family N-acetyltransferase, partial [Pseudomonadota bacterium]
MIIFETVIADVAENLCRQITASLPEYFGLPEVNEHYAQGVKKYINLAAKINDQYVGLISLEFPYPNSCNIYWMAILPEYMSQGIGTKLIDEACSIAKDKLAKTITVETLSPKNADENYLKTYHFYLRQGFIPLFDLKPQGYEWSMVYMARNLEGYYSHQKNKNRSI